MPKEITSAQNPFIKELVSLKQRSRSRKKTGKFLVEGHKEIAMAIEGKYEFLNLVVNTANVAMCEAFIKENPISPEAEIVHVAPDIYKSFAYRDSTEYMIAVCKSKPFDLDSLALNKPNPLILVAESVEKPGNIGALLRTADAANIDAVLIADPVSDLFNPNVIRSSIGCIFTNNIATGSTDEIIGYLKDRNIKIYTASLQAADSYNKYTYTGATAIVVGSEANGLSKSWNMNSDQAVKIPMLGKIDSMNVSVSAAILIFEAVRQRKSES